MYETYWQLDHKPFENAADARFFFPGESHQSALLKLRYAVENRRGGALLSGAAGTGKTYLISLLRESLGDNYTPFVHLVYPQMSPAELMAYLADELDGGADVDQTVRRAFAASRTLCGSMPRADGTRSSSSTRRICWKAAPCWRRCGCS